jgi:dinuclear metal center YbgI/SA1388 family protein
VPARDDIARFCDTLLESAAFGDGQPNGLQVPGAADVRLLVSGVSASLELFERAAGEGAQMVLTHHGLFWGSGPRTAMSAREKARLKTLFDADLSLLSYHLPLDAHPEVGNNAILCRRLGLDRLEPFAEFGGRAVGFIGALDPPVGLEELLGRVRAAAGGELLVFAHGPEEIGRVAVITGSAAELTGQAADAGADCFVSGEPKEPVMADAREAHIHYVAAGHHRTEVYGVQALGDLVAERFGIEHRFLDVPNPI